MAREAMIAADVRPAGLGYARLERMLRQNARWSGYRGEALQFLAGETSGENGVCVFA